MENNAGSSTFGAAVNMAKLSIGNGILALPFATFRGGLILSPIAITLIAIWNVVSCFMMIECKRVSTNHNFPSNISSSYSRISYCAFGQLGAIFTDLSVFVTLFGVCVSYQIAFAQFLKDIPSHPLHEWSDMAQTISYTYFSLLIVYPLACQRNIGFLAHTSFAGLCCLLLSIGVLIGYGSNTYLSHNEDHGESQIPTQPVNIPLWPESLSSFTTFSGVAIFCYGLCTFAFPIEESMQDRRQFPNAVIWSTILITIFYILIGDILASLYAQSETGIDQNILHNLPIHSTPAILVRVSLAIVCLVSIPLALVPSSQIVEQWLFSFYRSMTTTKKGTKSPHELLPTLSPSRSPDYQSISQSNPPDSDSNPMPMPNSNSNLDGEVVPDTIRYASRFFLLISCSFLAGHVPCFGLVISLLGSFTVCLLSFVLPSILHLVLVIHPQFLEIIPNNSKLSKLTIQWYIGLLLTICGASVCVFATTMTAFEAYDHFQSFGHC